MSQRLTGIHEAEYLRLPPVNGRFVFGGGGGKI
jgi:hypothetical protein